MKSALLSLLAIFFGFGQLLAQTHIALTKFVNESDVYALDSWERSIPDLLKSDLAQSPGIILVERENLDALFEEYRLSLSGFADSVKTPDFDQLTSADFILSGSIHELSGRYRIDVDIIRVKTGEIITEKAEAHDTQHLDKMINLLANNIKFHLTQETEYQESVSLKKYPTEYFFLATVGFTAAAIYFNSTHQDNYDQYKNTTDLREMNNFYDKANDAQKATAVMASLGVTALVGSIYCWIQNKSLKNITAHTRQKTSVQPAISFNKQMEVSFALQIAF